MTIDLDEIERLAKAATPGPWETTAPFGDPVIIHDGAAVATIRTNRPRTELDQYGDGDAAFIAAANPAAVLALLDRLRAAEAQVADLRLAVADTRTALVDALADSGQCMEQHFYVGQPRFDRFLKAVSDHLKATNGHPHSETWIALSEEMAAMRALEFTKANP